MNAQEYRAAIKAAAEASLREYPDDPGLRKSSFVPFLAGWLSDSDPESAAILRQVYSQRANRAAKGEEQQ
ncbi:hypothetical protein [Massilia endophytica]|uniref:hypothetical protein n=1 Tax=Massilia endophytica TaxID=2899220 RepID=UPI001E3EA067|nr:hypothetical protein [Massilia endophytica]UGQ45098.1 hypothetical protein LSQ66_14995 [Massilia endophytica]